MKISLRALFWSGIFVLFLLTQGCVGLVRYRDMNLQTQVKEPSILNLHNYASSDIAYFRQAEKLIRGKLVKSEGDEYGYYVIKYKSVRCNENWIYLNIFTCGLLCLFGGPISDAEFDLTAYLYIFDSNGKLLKEYKREGYVKQTAGLYYGHNPTKKVEQKYSELYEKIFSLASREAEEINAQLLESGPIRDEKRADAKANIEKYFQEK